MWLLIHNDLENVNFYIKDCLLKNDYFFSLCKIDFLSKFLISDLILECLIISD
jgi:hypothetical protein